MERSPRWDLARLLDPVSPDAFFDASFERAVLHVPRTDPGYYGSLLQLDDVDRVLTTLHLRHPAVTMVRRDAPLEPADYTYPSGLVDAARLYQAYEAGASVVLSNLEGAVPALMALCRSMEAELSCRFQCNIYLTPGGGAQGLPAHYDTHDVFVLQVHGRKRWRFYDAPLERPLPGQAFRPEATGPGPLTMELDLGPGELVYVPRGVMHEARSGERESCHITLGALTTSWTDLLVEAVARAGLSDSELRRALPPGFARRGFDRTEARQTFRALLMRAVERADFDAALDHFAEDLISSRHPLLRGQMSQLRRLETLDVDARASARPNVLYQLSADGDEVTLSAYGGQITLPAHAAEPLEYALTHEDYRIGALPGPLDDAGKLVLVKRLVREGLVEIL